MTEGQQQEMIEIQPTKSAVAAIAAGILVIVAGFLAYNYFAKVRSRQAQPLITEQAVESGEIQEVAQETEEEQKEVKEVAQGETRETPSEQQPQPGPTGGPEVPVSGTWLPTNYNKGEISGGNYTVKAGDTLWEVAEARYGSGFEWTKILDANTSSIGFLTNGSQALIEVGQNLVLPD
ncbi:MAG: LysM peptidoglycan-binding domain-containing protein [bacterium]|nr:LysM peptidoglycan-binding domain-containing protein [bacterium]